MPDLSARQPAPPNPPTPPAFVAPAGAVDAHCHIYGSAQRYPFATDAWYAPPDVDVDDYLTLLAQLGIDRAVFVHAALYPDNELIIDAIARNPDLYRGIAVIPESIGDRELERLDAAGIRGFRTNLTSTRGLQLDGARRLAERVAPLGWHAQFLMDVERYPDIERDFGSFATEVVIDHMGRPDVALGVQAPGFQGMLRLLRAGRGWAKLSAPYRTTRQPGLYDDIVPLAQALIETAPDRLVWGSDWPHVNRVAGSPMPDDGVLLNQLPRWATTPELLEKILVLNPQKLYGFTPVAQDRTR